MEILEILNSPFLLGAKYPWNYVMAFLALNLVASTTIFAIGTIQELKKPQSRS